ncbi:MAG: HD-GYP domain-containing protein [Candidatus Bipolaricaulota bacterium]|nr:HD-GYP domain-containing protein [Candidatus Bipolaricaulota bacterium]
MVKGLTVGRREDLTGSVEKRSTALELLVVQGAVEVTRQRIVAGKMFYLDAASEWEGFEFIYLLAGSLLLKEQEGSEGVVLHAGDHLYHHGLPERAYFQVEEDVEFLMVSSPPSFHLMRAELQDVLAIALSVEEKDEATAGHCHRIERLALLTGERLGLSGDKLISLSYAAYLHDIGKVKVPDEILNKPGPLTDEEWEEMRKHPIYGEQMLADKEFLADAAKLVLAHHERYDGSGYPNKLKGEKIPVEARIIAVVDSYDAMTSDRPYRLALPQGEACWELRRNAGTQFDPRVVEAFLTVLEHSDAS